MDERGSSGADEYTIRDLSRITGLTSERIRAWERRYDLLSPSRLPNGYRVYSLEDLRTLLQVKAAIDGGASIGEVAGSRHVAAPRLPTAARRALDAASRGDVARARRELREAGSSLTPVETWSQLVQPLLDGLGDRWAVGDAPIWLEHVVTRELRALMEARLAEAPSGGGPLAAVFCPEHEHHEMPLLAVAARLAETGWRPIVLGPHLPVDAAHAFVERHRPELAAVSITHLPGKNAARRLAGELGELAVDVRVVAGGRGASRYSDVLEAAGVSVVDLDELAEVRCALETEPS